MIPVIINKEPIRLFIVTISENRKYAIDNPNMIVILLLIKATDNDIFLRIICHRTAQIPNANIANEQKIKKGKDIIGCKAASFIKTLVDE